MTLVFKDFQKLPNLLKWLFKPSYKNVLKTSGLLVSKLNKSETGRNKAGVAWGFCYQKKRALSYCTLEPGNTDIAVPTHPGL